METETGVLECTKRRNAIRSNTFQYFVPRDNGELDWYRGLCHLLRNSILRGQGPPNVLSSSWCEFDRGTKQNQKYILWSWDERLWGWWQHDSQSKYLHSWRIEFHQCWLCEVLTSKQKKHLPWNSFRSGSNKRMHLLNHWHFMIWNNVSQSH